MAGSQDRASNSTDSKTDEAEEEIWQDCIKKLSQSSVPIKNVDLNFASSNSSTMKALRRKQNKLFDIKNYLENMAITDAVSIKKIANSFLNFKKPYTTSKILECDNLITPTQMLQNSNDTLSIQLVDNMHKTETIYFNAESTSFNHVDSKGDTSKIVEIEEKNIVYTGSSAVKINDYLKDGMNEDNDFDGSDDISEVFDSDSDSYSNEPIRRAPSYDYYNSDVHSTAPIASVMKQESSKANIRKAKKHLITKPKDSKSQVQNGVFESPVEFWKQRCPHDPHDPLVEDILDYGFLPRKLSHILSIPHKKGQLLSWDPGRVTFNFKNGEHYRKLVRVSNPSIRPIFCKYRVIPQIPGLSFPKYRFIETCRLPPGLQYDLILQFKPMGIKASFRSTFVIMSANIRRPKHWVEDQVEIFFIHEGSILLNRKKPELSH